MTATRLWETPVVLSRSPTKNRIWILFLVPRSRGRCVPGPDTPRDPPPKPWPPEAHGGPLDDGLPGWVGHTAIQGCTRPGIMAGSGASQTTAKNPSFPRSHETARRAAPLTLELALLLMGIALFGGVCITTIGPGGIFVTIALHQLLAPGPGTVAGTASVTFIATGLIGTLAYLRSGELQGPGPTRAAVILSLTSVAGALAGSWLNTFLDSGSFGALLGAFVLATGLLILWRERRGFRRAPTPPPESTGSIEEEEGTEATLDSSTPMADPASGPQPRPLTAKPSTLDLTSRRGDLWMAVVGIAVGLPAGLLGVGGPVLAVPLLVMLGVPMLLSVGLAQVQSVLISLFASLGYAVQGVIDWGLALLVGIPLVVGTALGWWIAHRIRPARLKVGLAVVLVLLGLHLLLSGPPGG